MEGFERREEIRTESWRKEERGVQEVMERNQERMYW